jgi:23S rRNA (adenine2030-N6)-methyltransferase
VNYRHSFHAGNFADLFKHAALLRALELMQAHRAPLLVVDTHAGAGRYRLEPQALATGEASALRRLLEDAATPAVFGRLKLASAPQPGGALLYPGSPLLAAARLRADDRLIACELRPDDGALLQAALRSYGPRAEARIADGYEALAPALRSWPGPALVLIDPPFERGDDYARTAEVMENALRAKPGAVILVWTPLKDLETFDALVRNVEARVPASGFAAQLRLRPPLDPLRFNGCALLGFNPPPGLDAALEDAGAWISKTLGEPGGGLHVGHLASAKRMGSKSPA